MAKDNTKKEEIELEGKKKTDTKVERVKKNSKPKKDSSKLKAEIQELKEALEKEKDRYVRQFAEFENYRRRTAKERIELFKTAGEEIMHSLLPILDDFDRAFAQIEDVDENEHFKGIKLIYAKFFETLKYKGLELLTIDKDTDFDPDLHEALTQIEAETEDKKGKIIDVVEKGYKLGDKIIRHPKVVITK